MTRESISPIARTWYVYIRPRGRCFIVRSFHARFTPSTTMNSLSRGFLAGGISDYTRVRFKESERIAIAFYRYRTSSPCCQDRYDRGGSSITWLYANSLLEAIETINICVVSRRSTSFFSNLSPINDECISCSII